VPDFLQPNQLAHAAAAAMQPQVYCEVATKDGKAATHFSSSISCLDPRTAAQVLHSTHSNGLTPSAASDTISCERYLSEKYAVQLQLPDCPCIVVEPSEDAQQRCSSAGGSSGDDAEQRSSITAQEMYRTYPVEFCW
jgi:hypothetical protein